MSAEVRPIHEGIERGVVRLGAHAVRPILAAGAGGVLEGVIDGGAHGGDLEEEVDDGVLERHDEPGLEGVGRGGPFDRVGREGEGCGGRAGMVAVVELLDQEDGRGGEGHDGGEEEAAQVGRRRGGRGGLHGGSQVLRVVHERDEK